MTDLSAVKAQQQRTWALGDFAMIGWHTVFPGELMCEAAGLRAGQKVLDVATGSGNTALSAARRNCEAVGIDYVPALVERARERAAAERLPARFEVGDCESIPFADGSFDVVLVRLRLDLRPATGAGRHGAAPGVPAGRHDRHGQLDAGRLLGRKLRLAGAVHSAAGGPAARCRVGHRTAPA